MAGFIEHWQAECTEVRGFCLVLASQPASVVAKVLDNRRVSPTAINLWVRSIAAPPIRRDSPGGLMLPLSIDCREGDDGEDCLSAVRLA